MENTNNTPGFLGITPAMMAKYNTEYRRTNPHNLQGIREPRPRIVKSQFVFSTRKTQ